MQLSLCIKIYIKIPLNYSNPKLLYSYFYSFPNLQKLAVKTLQFLNLFQGKFQFHFHFPHPWLSFLSKG